MCGFTGAVTVLLHGTPRTSVPFIAFPALEDPTFAMFGKVGLCVYSYVTLGKCIPGSGGFLAVMQLQCLLH